MKPLPHILTFSLLLFLPSCSKETIDVGSMDGLDGGPADDAQAVDPGATASAQGTGGNGGVGGAGGQTGTLANALACIAASSRVVATPADNYSFASSLSMPAIKAKAHTDLTFDWSDMKADLRGNVINPGSEIRSVWVILFNVSPEGLQNRLNSDSLASSDMVTSFVYRPDGKTLSATLSQFTVNGTAVPPATLLSSFDETLFPPDNYTYAVFVSKDSTLSWSGSSTLMIQAFQINSQWTNTVVWVSSSSSALSFVADLQSLRPLHVVAAEAGSIDWSTLEMTGLGTPFHPSRISSVVVGHYPQTRAELEAAFPRLEDMAADLYRGPSGSGTTADLAALTNARGVPFAGIDSTGTWLLALRCDDCMNPAPPYLTILEPCGKDRVNEPTSLGATCQLEYSSRFSATFSLSAPECSNGLCLKPAAAPSTTEAFDTGPYCAQGCTQDSDCDGHIRNASDPNDKGCRLGYACGIPFVKGLLCCRSMCMCKDFTEGATPAVPVACQGDAALTCGF
jgi:hypothetical protein